MATVSPTPSSTDDIMILDSKMLVNDNPLDGSEHAYDNNGSGGGGGEEQLMGTSSQQSVGVATNKLRRSALKKQSTSGSSSKNSPLLKVQFRDVWLREYGMVLGDNPAVSHGAPVQLDWDKMLADFWRMPDGIVKCRWRNS